MKKIRARKKYFCDITGAQIEVGEMYTRINIRGVGVYHFKKDVTEHQIKNHIYPDIFYSRSPEEQEHMCDPRNYDSFEQEIWANMPDEF